MKSDLDVHSYALPEKCASGCRYVIMSLALKVYMSIIYKEEIGSSDPVMVI